MSALTAPPPESQVDPVEFLYRQLENRVKTARPKDDVGVLEKTYRYARECHGEQKRRDGSPYMTHPLHVTLLLAGMQMDMVCLQTGLLHDVVEDTKGTVEEIRRLFGEEVARCVDGVTKLSKVNFYSREEQQAESVRKMLLAMVTDIRVIIVKLADRLHNMQTLGALARDRQERIALETLEIYAPIAHRLGMGKIRGELEDLAFEYVEPDAWAELKREIDTKREANEGFLKEIQKTVEQQLAREGIPARVDGRVKRAYSVYQKIKRQKISLDQVYDLLALRIITDSVKNCYAALGVIHNDWHPIPGRIKDFIAIPRPNLYQSLHTSVIGPGGQSFEVQIRTDEMHKVAEEGIAAHWKYKEGKKGHADDDRRITWLRQLVEWQHEVRDSTEFMSGLKVELYPEEVYTFTPRGRVIVLPRDATSIDFAYAIHSDVGNTCVGAKVNGRIVPLKYNLRNGDVVEILTQPGHMPSKDWLALVKTQRARNKIRHEINTTERAKAVEIGQKYLEKEARRLGVSLNKATKADMEGVAGEYGYGKIEDLHAALGYGKFSPRQVLQKLAPDSIPPDEPAKPAAALSPTSPGQPAHHDADLVIKVRGIDDLLVYRAKCCNPIKGEGIVGYITRGKGVAVHSVSCTNVQNLMYEVDRKIEVEWARSTTESFPVKLTIRTDDRPGMLNQVTNVLFTEQSNIRNLEARGNDDKTGDGAMVEFTAEIRDKKQLERIVSSLRRISGVRDVERIQ
jgi:guanosine-3',5'-bis(diphosphate) 3'-pyrophosphohydrolase